MKTLILATSFSLVLGGVAGEAGAACAAGAGGVTQVTGTPLSTLLSGKTVCVKKAGGGWESQEEHRAGGALWDYKKGPGDRVDPSESVGTWAVSRTGVNYNYGAGGSYIYQVYDNGNGTHSFCAGGKDIVAKIQPGTGAPCSGF